ETMIAKGENNEDLYQPAEWRAAREKVLRNVKEVCETVCPVVREVGSAARGTDLPCSDIGKSCETC
ncbi:unnamed protein product, partial [Durusdinium trenchii]